jgi:predicted nucleic acid-binding protein
MLRSMDAVHLASALSIRADLSAFIAYDHRLGDAASVVGLALLTPGRDDLRRAPGI